MPSARDLSDKRIPKPKWTANARSGSHGIQKHGHSRPLDSEGLSAELLAEHGLHLPCSEQRFRNFAEVF